MNSSRLLAGACIFAAAALAPGQELCAQAIDTVVMAAHARALAHDSLRGRDTGSAGERAAARYIGGVLEQLGLQNVDSAGFRVPLPLLRVRLAQDSRITLHRDVDSTGFAVGRDFLLSGAGRNALSPFRGPAVLVPSSAADVPDSAVHGRVVVTGGPVGEAGRAALRRWRDAGALAVILPVLSDSQFRPFAKSSESRMITDADVDEQVWQPDLPILLAGPSLARALLHDVHAGDADRTWLDLDAIIDARLQFDTEVVESANVAALVPGTDPSLRDEIVVLTAHYDHLGIGPTVADDSIYNGFSDNAAGVAMLLEIARILQQRPAPRSVLFLFTSGEERGLLGSAWWAAHAPVSREHVVAVLNLDAGAPAGLPIRWRVAGDSARGAVGVAARVIESRGWTADVTPANANSDHWPFMERGVPTVFLVPGREWQDLRAVERDSLHAQWDRYHHPDDEWRSDYPLAGLRRYAELALDITRALADWRHR